MSFKLFLIATLLTISQEVIAEDYYKATSNLNVRTGAGKGYSVSFTLQKGDEVVLLSKGINWYKIEFLGSTGYANSKYLEFSRNTTDPEISTNSNQLVINIFLILAFTIIVIFVVFNIYQKIRDNELLQSVTDNYRGTKSERNLVLMLLKAGVPSRYIFHDLYIEKGKSEFSQADLVILTNVGIIVIEVKDYSGWIFGSGNHSQWTKVLAYGSQKYTFYNPIKQNNSHIAELKRQLYQFDDIPFYSIIAFYGECELKSINYVPVGTYVVRSERVLEVIADIFSENNRFSYTNENEVIRILSKAVTNGGIIKNQIQHNENIRNMLGNNRVYD